MTSGLRITVLTSCTGLKAPVPPGKAVPAEDLYRGQQHIRLMRGVRTLRAAGGLVDVWIVSAGHGLVHGCHPLAPYDRTFQGRSVSERRALADDLGVSDAVRDLLRKEVDLTLVLLGENYLDACRLGAISYYGSPTLVLAGGSAALSLPSVPARNVVALKLQHTRHFSCGLVGLKGEVAARLLICLADDPRFVEGLTEQEPLLNLAARGRPAVGVPEAASLF